ncbi:hypothetical protein QO002_005710 [Pararhizobium capsulatum DSM 1112]|uniref:Uncharacterized protein n=1 Tax=Pararhizobium capsulatum DSM 1112 TaxID=1121113 RepID=A0ABU0BZ27_9HYPH|nr:hypothetical protein [Pararhizobium capsulatum DSM 1112]
MLGVHSPEGNGALTATTYLIAELIRAANKLEKVEPAIPMMFLICSLCGFILTLWTRDFFNSLLRERSSF